MHHVCIATAVLKRSVVLRVNFDSVVRVRTAHEFVSDLDLEGRNIAGCQCRNHDRSVELLEIILIFESIVGGCIKDFELGEWIIDRLAAACDGTSGALLGDDLGSVGFNSEVHITRHILISIEVILGNLDAISIIVLLVVPLVSVAFSGSVVTNRVVSEAISTNQLADGHYKVSI